MYHHTTPHRHDYFLRDNALRMSAWAITKGQVLLGILPVSLQEPQGSNGYNDMDSCFAV